MWTKRAAVVVGVALACAGCKTRLWEIEQLKPKFIASACRVQQAPLAKADVLFMIDNSGSMDAMQEELRSRFPLFLKVFHDLAQKGTLVDLHIGVVTSDYGAGTSMGQCSPSPGGQRGKLQALGGYAKAGCKPPVGANFIQYAFADVGDGPNNLPPGQSLDETFTCMASIGAHGCGYEHQLESVRAALQDPIDENVGFLRDDALLVVLFLTNEDDCSAPPDTDLFDAAVQRYGQSYSFRCSRYGVLCDGQQPPYGDSGGALQSCVPAPNPGDKGPGRLYDIGRYVNLFTRPAFQGGIKFDPADVLLAAIDAPSEPFQVVLADPSSGISEGKPYDLCAVLDENKPCLPVLQHSCQNAIDGAFFGDPSVRLNTVINAAQNHSLSSLCAGDYTAALETVANLIVSQTGECCFTERLPPDPRDPTNNDLFLATCTVEEVTQNANGTTTTVEIPRCAAGVPTPCWYIEKKDQCAGLSPQSFGLTVNHGGSPAPPHTTARSQCRGIDN